MNRLHHIDALRGIALLGILLLHAYGQFGMHSHPDHEFLNFGKLNHLSGKFIDMFITNKAFALFSIMFGFSFYLQMEKGSTKHSNFNAIFAWRLSLLFIFGYLLAIIFNAEILTKYAIIGFVLLALYKVSNRFLVILAILLLLHIPLIVQIIRSINDPDIQFYEPGKELWEKLVVISKQGSLLDWAKINMGESFTTMWYLNFTSGRIVQIMGYFLIGLLIGRSGFFTDLSKQKKTAYILIPIAVLFYLLFRFFRSELMGIGALTSTSVELISKLFTGYMNIFMVVILVSLFIIAYQINFFQKLLDLLIPYGKMGLTNYTFQSVIGVFLFYGFGFEIYKYAGPFLSIVVGLMIFTFLLFFSFIWLKFFRYGPLEWVWRSMTYQSLNIPMRIKKSDSGAKNNRSH
jgi:uncharacterized protein